MKCLKAPLPNIGETFETDLDLLLELMGRLGGLKLEKIVIMDFNLDKGRLKSKRAKKVL